MHVFIKSFKIMFLLWFHYKCYQPDSTYSSYPSWSSSDNLTMYKASPSRREEKNNQQNSSSSSLTDAIRDMTNRRVTAAGLKKYTHLHRYHPHHQQHQHANDQSQPTTERSLIAQGYPSHHLQPIPDDFETQAQNYDAGNILFSPFNLIRSNFNYVF